MLVPAILYKEEIEKAFAKELYSDDYFFYAGYAHCHGIPSIKPEDDDYQYAIINSKEKLIGYFAYTVYMGTDSVRNFGFYSFDKGNALVAKDVFAEMEKLVKRYRRVEWRMIAGNPVKKHYDKFCKKHGGNIVMLHDVCRDNYGRYRGEFIYEIVKQTEVKNDENRKNICSRIYEVYK